MTHTMENHSAGAARLEVTLIDGPGEFLALREAWERLYQADPESTVFLSWPWLNQAFQDNLYRWSVLVVRKRDTSGDIIAALPLKYRVHWSRSRQELQTELEAGGRLVRSAYTGVLCHPEYETAALQALAARLTHLPWTRAVDALCCAIAAGAGPHRVFSGR